MTIFIRWAHVAYKYFSFILGMASFILCGLWVQHGLWGHGVPDKCFIYGGCSLNIRSNNDCISCLFKYCKKESPAQHPLAFMTLKGMPQSRYFKVELISE